MSQQMHVIVRKDHQRAVVEQEKLKGKGYVTTLTPVGRALIDSEISTLYAYLQDIDDEFYIVTGTK